VTGFVIKIGVRKRDPTQHPASWRREGKSIESVGFVLCRGTRFCICLGRTWTQVLTPTPVFQSTCFASTPSSHLSAWIGVSLQCRTLCLLGYQLGYKK